MSCFYDMNELDLPFEKIVLDSYDKSPKNLRPKIEFYTLRVCNDCRSEWMDSIVDWWKEKVVKL